jgi:hypothetical protein
MICLLGNIEGVEKDRSITIGEGRTAQNFAPTLLLSYKHRRGMLEENLHH